MTESKVTNRWEKPSVENSLSCLSCGLDATAQEAMLNNLLSQESFLNLFRKLFCSCNLISMSTSSSFFSFNIHSKLGWKCSSLLMYRPVYQFCFSPSRFPYVSFFQAQRNNMCGPDNCPYVCLMFWAACDVSTAAFLTMTVNIKGGHVYLLRQGTDFHKVGRRLRSDRSQQDSENKMWCAAVSLFRYHQTSC